MGIQFTIKSLFTAEEFARDRSGVLRLLSMHATKFDQWGNRRLKEKAKKLAEMPIKEGNLRKKGDKSGFWTSRHITLFPGEIHFSHKAKATAGKISVDPRFLTHVQARGKEIVLTILSDDLG